VIGRAGQGQAHQAQVEALVLGVSALGDCNPAVGGGDVGVEVRPVEDQGLRGDVELRHRLGEVGLLDGLQILQAASIDSTVPR